MRITQTLHDRVIKLVADDEQIGQMLGVIPYVGYESNRGKTPKPAVREVEIVTPEEWALDCQRLDKVFFKGFNRGIQLMPLEPLRG